MSRRRVLRVGVVVLCLVSQLVGVGSVAVAAPASASVQQSTEPPPGAHVPRDVEAPSRTTSELPAPGSAKRAEWDRLQAERKAESDLILARERKVTATPGQPNAVLGAAVPAERGEPLPEAGARDLPPGCEPQPGEPWHVEYTPGPVTRLGTKYEPGRARMSLTNHGTQTWQPGQVRLGYHRVRADNSIIPGDMPRTDLPVAVPPGAQVQLDAVFAFLPPGEHLIAWDLWVNGLGWLSENGICTLVVRYTLPNQAPSVAVQYPANNGTTTSRTPLLNVHGDDPDAWPNELLSWQFRLCKNAAMTSGCHTSSWGSFPWYTVPDGLLAWNEMFWWSAKASDGQAVTDPIALGVPPHRVTVVVPAPDIWRTVGAGLGLASRDGLVLPYAIWTRTETDAQVAGAGVPLRVQRTFSSGAPASHSGAFGQGWLSMFDASAQWSFGQDTLTITYPDGRQEIFGRQSDGSLVSRLERGATNRVTVAADGTITVKTSSSETLTYTKAGALTRVATDGAGALRFEQDSGGLVRRVVQEPSGRALNVTWTTGPSGCTARPRISVIETEAPATGTEPLRWQYGYQCQHLVSRTDPTGAATRYQPPDGFGNRYSDFVKSPEGRFTAAPERMVAGGPSWDEDFIEPGTQQTYFTVIRPGDSDLAVRGRRASPGHVAEWVANGNPYGGPRFELCDGSVLTEENACYHPEIWYFDELNRLRIIAHRPLSEQPSLATERQWFYSATTGRFTSFYDENFNVVSMQYDGAGNLKASYTYRDDDTQVTRDSTFYLTGSGEKLSGRMRSMDTIPRQSTAPTNTFGMFQYDTQGRLVRRQGNPTTETPGGPVTDYTYTTGSEQAVGARRGGTGTALMPAGLLRTVQTPAGVTTLSYNANGDVTQVVDPIGLHVTYDYDAVGRRVAQTVDSTAPSGGALTEYRYDRAGRLVLQLDPYVTGTGRLRVCTDYDRDGNRIAVHESTTDCMDGNGDGKWDDRPYPFQRVTKYRYDSANRLDQITNAAGGTTTYEFGVLNRVFIDGDLVTTITDPAGRKTRYTYDHRRRLTRTTAVVDTDGQPGGAVTTKVVAAYGYDPAGRLISQSDGLGRTVSYEWTDDDLPLLARSADAQVWRNTYDGAGRLTAREALGEPPRTWTYDAEGRLIEEVIDPAGVNRRTLNTYDQAGRVVAVTRHDGTTFQQAAFDYDAAGNVLEERVGPASNPVSVTRYVRDRRGLPIKVIDPRGTVEGADADAYTTINEFDELGRLSGTFSAEVTVEEYGRAARSERLETRFRYTYFGELNRVLPSSGYSWLTYYDALGRPTREQAPALTPPYTSTGESIWPSRTTTYNAAGEVSSVTEANGARTDFTYSFPEEGPARVETGPSVDGQRPTTTTRQYWTGQIASVTNAVGATTQYWHDALGRLSTVTLPYDPAEGVPPGPLDPNYRVAYGYDRFGYLSWTQSPDYQSWTRTNNAVGEVLTEKAPGISNPTRYTYDIAGRRTVTDPSGETEAVDYDSAGRPVSISHLGVNGAVIDRSTTEYDPAGNVIAATSPRGARTTFEVDALNRVTGVTQPVSGTESITTHAGYDVTGNPSEVTDGRGNTTWHTYNNLGLRTSTVEPATAAHPEPADRTWTNVYDAAGLPVRSTEPGGVTVARTFDPLGRLTVEDGTAAGSPTGQRRFSYDPMGNVTRTNNGGGDQTFTYSQRGLLLESPANAGGGATTYTYDGGGRVTSRTDPAGARTRFDWTTFGAPDKVTDIATGHTVAEYAYSTANGRLEWEGRANGGMLNYDYGDRGRLAHTFSFAPSGSNEYQIDHYYDADGNLIERTFTDADVQETGDLYGHDLAGRLTSTTDYLTGAARDYTWDPAGNRTSEVTTAPGTPRRQTDSTYDDRNRLLTTNLTVDDQDPVRTGYTHSPRGDLLTVDGPASPPSAATAAPGLISDSTMRYDGLGRLISQDGIDYAYDGLDRVTTRTTPAGTNHFAYNGFAPDPTIAQGPAGTEQYLRDTNGGLLAVTRPGGTPPRLWPATDGRGDITAWRADTTTGGLAGQIRTDPFGQVESTTGETSSVSYQGDWADPDTGMVNMHARWYSPAQGRFTTRDTITQPITNGATAGNLYGYANANPTTNTDPTGHLCQIVPFVCTIPGLIGNVSAGGAVAGGVGGAAAAPELLVGAAIIGAAAGIGYLAAQLSGPSTPDLAYYSTNPTVSNCLAMGGSPTSCASAVTSASPPVASAPPASGITGSVNYWGSNTTTSTSVSHTSNSRVVTTTQTTTWWQQRVDYWSNGAATNGHQASGTNVQSWWTQTPTIDASTAVTVAVTAPQAAVSAVGASSEAAGQCGLLGTMTSCLAEVIYPRVGGGCADLAATMAACTPRAAAPGNPGGVREGLTTRGTRGLPDKTTISGPTPGGWQSLDDIYSTVADPAQAWWGSVTRNALRDHEPAQAQSIVDFRGGHFEGAPRPSFPGIDGWHDGIPASLKQYSGRSPTGVLRHASDAEKSAREAGYSEVTLYIDAPNVSAARLVDFAQNGPLSQIPRQGTINQIYVRTGDGWIMLPGAD